MPSASLKLKKIFKSLPSIQSAGDVVYGAAGLTYAIAEFMQHLQPVSEIVTGIFNTLPLVSVIFSSYDFIKFICTDLRADKKESSGNEKGMKFLLKLISNSVLFSLAYENLSNIISIGSAAFGVLCLGLVVKAAADVCISLYDYRKAADAIRPPPTNPFDEEGLEQSIQLIKKRNAALATLIANIFTLTGWGLLALTPFAGPAAAPMLIAIGSIVLIAAGIPRFYSAYKNYSLFANNSLNNITPQELRTTVHLSGSLRGSTCTS